MRIAIMQPYFIPYAGYFRLFCAADLFVIFDCVQFIRRGWIHRNRLPNSNGELQWLTLPLAKAPQSIEIKNLTFAEGSQAEWAQRLRAFPQLCSPDVDNAVLQRIQQLDASPTEYLTSTLKITCETLDLPFSIAYSSTLNLPPDLKGQDRILAIAKHYGATDYINPPGGKALYQPESFQHHNIKLHFLSNYQGCCDSVLQRLLDTGARPLRNDIIEQSTLDTL